MCAPARPLLPSPRSQASPLLVVAVVLLAAAGCSRSSGGSPANPVLPSGTGGMAVIGHGTDVFGRYAVEENKLGKVLDVDALNAAGWLVHDPSVAEYDYAYAEGSTVTQYMSQLGGSVGLSGSYAFFSGEAQVAFSQDTYRKEGYSYVSIVEHFWKESLKLDNSMWNARERLRPFLTPAAKAAIDDTDTTRRWTGAEVIAAFGTHVIDGVYTGGRLDYHLAIQIKDAQYQTSLHEYAKADFKSTFASASMTQSLDSTIKTAMDSYSRVRTINAKGGAAQYAHPEDDAQYQLWKASLDSNPVYCGIISGALTGL